MSLAAFAALLLGSTGTRALAADASDADKSFVAAAASGGMAEVKLGQYAADNGSNAAVKKFGKHMESDHTKANKKLESVCKKEKVECPTSMNADDSANVEKLTKMTGAEFDKAYASAMVADHEKTITLFDDEVKNGSNAALKKFAEDTLPTLKKHLEMAKKMETTEAK